MKKLLTIAIPTYNRANYVEEKLVWLSEALKGFESDCEIIIADNCSTDHTQEIVEKYQDKFTSTPFTYKRQEKNLGVMLNVAYCFDTATSEYVWVIGDDDPIRVDAIAYIIENVTKHPEISLIFLNFSCRFIPTGEILYERSYHIQQDELRKDGRAIFEHNFKTNNSSVGFMTAQVYRTDSAQTALHKWYSGLDNREAQVYWTAYCALQGSILTSKENYVENAFGVSHWMRDPKLLLAMQYTDLPSVYIKLMELGYPSNYCLGLLISHFFKNNWRVFFGGLRRHPKLAIAVIIPYLKLVTSAVWRMLVPPQSVASRFSNN
ncbi:glycosyltransferase family 2 protein [Brunnivagina elsteri]|uniref:Glycosyltransferase n=1 Tax=Brunnivagina elsteri CCALA 953 TaxID=987040 RepID=A0A2A2TB97_9CYAN|nr:glycosyltransferase family 2 protein [Calothrix elsteri]PAX51067.1 glycosyltransferase [Calothrix elsteri CCALA 953]